MPQSPDEPRQRVEKTGRRRARLTPVPESDDGRGDTARVERPRPAVTPDAARAKRLSPRDEEILRDKPPHWAD